MNNNKENTMKYRVALQVVDAIGTPGQITLEMNQQEGQQLIDARQQGGTAWDEALCELHWAYNEQAKRKIHLIKQIAMAVIPGEA